MEKWADFLISAVRYNAEETHIEMVRVHEDLGDNVGDVKEILREGIVAGIKNGKTYLTIFKTNEGKWKKGEDVRIIRIGDEEFIRTDRNATPKDNLGSLPRF